MVVAESCGSLAGLVSSDMRQSLLLSMLQQLAADKDAGVQSAAACSLALLLPHLANLDKYRAVRVLACLFSEAGVVKCSFGERHESRNLE